MRKTDSAGGIVLNNIGKILLATKDGMSWMLPKGHLDKNEELLTAAKREIWEETGLPISEMKLESREPLGMYQRHKIRKDNSQDISEFKSIYIFKFTTGYTGDLEPVDLQHKTAQWFDKEKIVGLLRHPEDKKFFNSVIDKL